MKKSIEQIWKDGFLKKGALVAPKVNDLYNQKSNHIIDKMQRMFVLNRYYVIALMFIHLCIGFAAGVPVVGVLWFLLFIPLIIISKKGFEDLSGINKTINSYDYLKSFDRWLEGRIEIVGKVYQFFYPLYFLGLVGLLFFNSYYGEAMLSLFQTSPENYILGILPLNLMLIVGLLFCVIAYFSKTLYYLDFKSVYGRIIKKLKDTLQEMEELRFSAE